MNYGMGYGMGNGNGLIPNSEFDESDLMQMVMGILAAREAAGNPQPLLPQGMPDFGSQGQNASPRPMAMDAIYRRDPTARHPMAQIAPYSGTGRFGPADHPLHLQPPIYRIDPNAPRQNMADAAMMTTPLPYSGTGRFGPGDYPGRMRHLPYDPNSPRQRGVGL